MKVESTHAHHSPARLVVLALAATLALASNATFAQAAPAAAAHPSVTDSGPHTAARNPRTMFATWVTVWNGDTAKASSIISPDFRVHAALLDGTDGSSLRGVEGLVGLVDQIRSVCTDLRFDLEVGPLADGRYVSARWVATGTYAGGFPGAKAAPGTVITYSGTDTLRLEHGKFAEYWLNADTLSLLQQLQAG
ncbi:ester cyclase [Amycolatopsis mongoliensis]|uniref:Ester cyclase n=1 Tax=Amycolatopsis mongoliensis TaxID=715475 RepID=A0A9Y2JJX9_9PSEU|nr:ester cyclase [Amycolatopsis sp. 4-36]WIX98673.1 ester cyclase [Amycolatopsis sp. 4-36]